MAAAADVSTTRMLVELVVAAAFVAYFSLVAANVGGIMDLFLRRMERNRKVMRRLVGAPVDRAAELPPHHETGRRIWKYGFGLCAVAGLAFIGVRVVTLVNAYLG